MRYNLDFDGKKGPPKPGTYYCTRCNRRQIVPIGKMVLKPCPKCGGVDFKTI